MASPLPARLEPDSTRRDWSVAELELLPDIGNRHEIIDGELLVTPAPKLMHQVALRELAVTLHPSVVAVGLELRSAPAAVRRGARSEDQPDILTDSLAWRPRESERAFYALPLLTRRT